MQFHANKCNEGRDATSNRNKCKSMLASASGSAASTYTIYTRGGGQLPNPNECHSMLTSATRGDMLTLNPNECNSTLTSVTGGIFSNPYILIKKSSGATVYPGLICKWLPAQAVLFIWRTTSALITVPYQLIPSDNTLRN